MNLEYIKKYRESIVLFIAQILVHLSIIPMIFYADPIHYLFSFFVYSVILIFGISMTYHRFLAHKMWEAPKWFEYFGTFIGAIGLNGSSIAWAAVHREHHAYTDSEKDPHAPKNGFIKAYFLPMFHIPKLKFAKDMLRNKLHQKVHRYYIPINILYSFILFMIDPFMVIYLHLFPAMILWTATSSINTITHMFGYRNYETEDESTNNLIFGYFVWGEGWHNNHHHDPNNYNFQRKWWELDVCARLISLIKI